MRKPVDGRLQLTNPPLVLLHAAMRLLLALSWCLAGTGFSPQHRAPLMFSSQRPTHRHRARTCIASSQQPLRDTLERFDPATIRCPFFRRRASDLLEAAVLVGRWLASRHKSLDLSLGLLPLSTVAGQPSRAHGKALGASHDELLAALFRDFHDSQCQVTGRISRRHFSETCVFDGPDPDMPVKGLDKYLSAAATLFNHRQSRCEILGLASSPGDQGRLEPIVFWRIEGVVNLPWHPRIKPYVGATHFRTDADGLIVAAQEFWTITAFDAFVSTVVSDFGAPPAAPASTLRSGLEEGSWLEELKEFPVSLSLIHYPLASLPSDVPPSPRWFEEFRSHLTDETGESMATMPRSILVGR